MRKGIVFVAIVGALAILAPQASAQDTVAVFITNISKQIISPPVVISHSFETRIFWPGQPASDELAALAEDGDPSALAAALDANEHVLDVVVADGPLLPGETLRFDVEATGKYDRISAVGMLVSTNDAFFGLRPRQLPLQGKYVQGSANHGTGVGRRNRVQQRGL